MDRKTASFATLAGDGNEIPNAVMCKSIRSIGSAALNYGYVAAGQFDIYWEIGCWSWDVAAGIVIAREAGGKVYGRGGRPMDDNGEVLFGRHYLVVRQIGDTPNEKGSDAQDRIAKDFFSRVQEWEAT